MLNNHRKIITKGVVNNEQGRNSAQIPRGELAKINSSTVCKSVYINL